MGIHAHAHTQKTDSYSYRLHHRSFLDVFSLAFILVFFFIFLICFRIVTGVEPGKWTMKRKERE